MKLVNCSQEYWEFVRRLRNDERVADGFIETEKITKSMQINYMRNQAQNYRVAILNGSALGYVGVIDDDFRICTHPDFQGKGVAKFMINESLKIWPNAFARVKISNVKSLKLFKTLGFKEKYIILTRDI
ncbi:GNAT family N-acetyltransferase [Winogradskyella sp. UBA3174]|uniref:GNAT family N-acetyltransferase n=1 Tax=Winogradskyella sp. UBA3174 TaxID=1947785 RepID=UPI0025E0028F|nr:GNAT family N-acetyltransferase [Winogradskyella sp. UBA3174]